MRKNFATALTLWYQTTVATPSPSQQERMKVSARQVFLRQQFAVAPVTTNWRGWKWALAGMAGTIALLWTPYWNGLSTVAGSIESFQGTVELIRGDKSSLITDATKLRIGDQLRLGQRSQARVVLPDQLVANLSEHSHVSIVDNDQLFLTKGGLDSAVIATGSINTDRGLITGSPNSHLLVSVSDTGETYISPLQNWIEVTDVHNDVLILDTGDQLVLRSDTRLADIANDDVSDLQLSTAQLRSVRAKLTIARSKIVTGIEKSLSGHRSAAHRDFVSARNTFLSITQTLKTSRELSITRRQNTDVVAVSDVANLLAERGVEAKLLTEVVAVQTLFDILQYHGDKLAFGKTDSGVIAFDRFVILQHLFSLGTPAQQVQAEVLLDHYVTTFWRQIQQSELQLEQLAWMQQEIAKLPSESPFSHQFLVRLSAKLDPYLSKLVGEAIRERF